MGESSPARAAFYVENAALLDRADNFANIAAFDPLHFNLPMNRRHFLRTTAAVALAACTFAHAAPAAGPRRKILFFTKSSGFEHDVISYKKGQPSFAEKVLSELGAKNNWEFVFSKDGSLFTPQYLAQFDALLFYSTGDLCAPGIDGQSPMTPAGKQALLDYVAGSKGFIGSHSASDTFHTNNEAKKGPERYQNFGRRLILT